MFEWYKYFFRTSIAKSNAVLTNNIKIFQVAALPLETTKEVPWPTGLEGGIYSLQQVICGLEIDPGHKRPYN